MSKTARREIRPYLYVANERTALTGTNGARVVTGIPPMQPYCVFSRLEISEIFPFIEEDVNEGGKNAINF